VRTTFQLVGRFFPHAALAVSLAACGGSSSHIRGQDSPYLHIVAPSEAGDDKVPPAAAVTREQQPVSGTEQADPEDAAVPEIIDSDAGTGEGAG
jgi:hypothetical protein